MKNFKIHSICLCKNEADIIAYTLKKALLWSDHIYVYDNGSTDDTWEIVKSLAAEDSRIVAWRSDNKTYTDGLRGEVFAAFRNQTRHGDWWCKLDADEVYIDDPREFLASIRPPQHVVWNVSIEYYITRDDLKTIDFSSDIETIVQSLKYYKKATHSEIRFFQYRDGLVWQEGAQWPKHLGLVHPRRILMRHYKYRSPSQIESRMAVRAEALERADLGWSHWRAAPWEEKVCDTAECEYDDGRSELQVAWDELPVHLESTARRTMKTVMHGIGLWP